MIPPTDTLKYSSLILLGIQNLSYGLLLPISRIPDKDGNVFFGPTAVVTTEVLKGGAALLGKLLTKREVERWTDPKFQLDPMRPMLRSDGHTHEQESPNEAHEEGDEGAETGVLQGRGTRQAAPVTRFYSIWQRKAYLFAELAKQHIMKSDRLALVLPAILFVFQSNLQIQSASYLDATEFQLLSQLKLVTAAIFSVLILKRKLKRQHWACIILLVVGICFLRLGEAAAGGQGDESSSSSREHSNMSQSASHPQAFWIGFIMIVSACCFSGLASVTMEYYLKNKIDYWTTNLYLAGYSIIPASIPLLINVWQRGQLDIYRSFNIYVWLVIFLNAIGGLLVSMVMKYADNILKGFAIAASLLATVTIESHATFSPFRLFGTLVVIGSMFGYSQASIDSSSRKDDYSPLDEDIQEAHDFELGSASSSTSLHTSLDIDSGATSVALHSPRIQHGAPS